MKQKYLDTTTELTGDVVKVVMTKEVRDRDGEIVKVDGIDTTNFMKNPIVLWGHRSYAGDIEDVVGKATNLIKEDVNGVKTLSAEVEFADHPKAQYLKQMVKKGIVTSLSIGFNVEKDGYDANEKIINKSELYELSFVNLPANPEARVLQVVKGLKLEQEEEDKVWKKLASAEANKPVLKTFRSLFLSKEVCEKFEYEKTGDELADIKNIFDRIMEHTYTKSEEIVETPQPEAETQPEPEPTVEVLSKDELKALLFSN